MDTLISKLTDAGLCDGIYIKLDDYQIVEVADFISLFGTTDGSYTSLISEDVNEDGSNKGYVRFFEAWKTAGIIN